ncbi:LLM class F420-dependent oxidoreductase [Amycolatopsis antarctica]|uniref:LLM class F420-dependent oxidoreductase n=1 Tax=Amycolatopsis antarctica TaxID=1854586 RepID=A0A263CZY2_9PSEU|nr:TIGR03564 family F420-dependent LLM class oxidoreductase [Amycolatopsis antarctica]OZM71438.1 LLM class F420-dependent oxidoreductase [Amycolatopsis antarctica]
MTIGVALPPGPRDIGPNAVDVLVRLAGEAAAHGLTSAWFPQLLDVDAVTVAALAGREVPGIAVGTAVVPLHPRHPLLLASLAQTAQAATGGRFALGLGAGSDALLSQAYGTPVPPFATHLREYLTALRTVVDGGELAFDGHTLRSHPPFSTAVAGADPVPLLVAAMGPKAVRVTGELADGTLPFLAGPRVLADRIVPKTAEAATAAGRPDPRIIALVPVIVTSDVDGARERVAEAFALYDRIPSYQRVIAEGGYAHARELAVIGDERTVSAALRDYRDAGATEIVGTQTGLTGDADRHRTWELLGSLA